MPIRVRPALVAVTTCLLVTSGCASLTAGSGSGSGAAPSTSPHSSPGPSTSPPTTTSPPTSTTPPSTPTTSPGASGCAAAFCDDFSSTKSGWDVGNEKHFYSQYDSYLGGTFRMGERHDAILTVPAPYDITKASSDYSVQVDAETILGPKSPKDAIYGLSCWNHEAHNKSTSAFVLSFTRKGAQIVLWDNTDGTTHTLKKMSWSGVVRPAPYRNQVRALCVQRKRHGRTYAELGMSVNGRILAKLYPQGGKSEPWTTGNRVGLIVGLTGADVFYDNFSITGA